MLDKKQKTFVIIDGNAIVHRAYHAIPPLTTKEGLMVNAVYGFTSMLLKVLEDLKPDYVAVTFDIAGGTFRDKIFTEYKAKRVKAEQSLYDQIPLIHDLVKAFGIKIYEKGGFEADDVIGTVVTDIRKKEKGIKSIIVTGDMDLLQLVDDDHVLVRALRKGLSDMVTYDEKGVQEKYGFGPKLVVDYKALRGDASDNIPGVPGIGEKTAKELIARVGGIEEIYKKIETLKEHKFSDSVIKKMIDGEASARMSFEIATIHCGVPDLEFNLEDCAVRPINREVIVPLFQRFDFVSLLRRLPGEKSDEAGETDKKAEKKLKDIKIEKIENESMALITRIKRNGQVAIKEIINGSSILDGDWQGFLVCEDTNVWQIDWTSLFASDKKAWEKLFADEKITLLGHDVKQLVKVLFHEGIEVNNQLFDVMIASYVLNSSTRAHDVRSIALRELGEELPETKQGSLFGPDIVAIARELSCVARMYEHYAKELDAVSDKGLFKEIEMKLIPVLAHMELQGVAVDVDQLKELSVEAGKEVEKLTKKIWQEAGEEFNISSPIQLRDVLYEKLSLNIPGIKKGKTGFSTAASELEKLRGSHPIIEYIEDYRELTKLQNTYLDVLPKLVNAKTGRIHTTFNQAVAATGRLSSSDPNIQNIPIRTEIGRKIRDTFISEPGNVLIAADYSQIELRIVASLAQDKKLMEIFERGLDVHKATAAAIHHVSLDEVTKEMRYAAKEINFGVLYGMGAFGLAWRAGIPQHQAKEFIEKYFTEFSGVKKYIDDILEFAKKEGYVETLFGRRRYIPELTSSNFQLRSAAERMAINMPIQGTAADLMKLAMIAVYNKIKKQTKMILQVHDELVLEVAEKEADEVAKMVKKEMEDVATLRVPIEVSVGVGRRWGEIK